MTEREDLERAIDAMLSGPAPLEGHTINRDKTVAVSTTQYWEDMDTCPRGVKVQLLGYGGVALYGTYDGKNKFFTNWAPLPKKRSV
jgi:hypothetical protein